MEQFNINKGVTIKPGLDVLPPPVTDDEYRALMAGEDRYLMTESNTLEEIEATFFYDTPIHWCATDLLEAISSTRLQLHRTMQAFVRALNQKLNGTGISAGSDKTGDVAQSGARAIGGAEIGRARNVNGLPVLPAIIPLSDGQTISILFHSPTAENRITNSDTLVAFQFLLNKKDVTHTVAPMSGRDMTLAQVTMKLANLAEKNSAKFQRAQKKKKALVDEITQLQADSDQKEDAMSDLADQVAAVEGQKVDLEQKINAVASEADSLYEENERLQTEIDQLNRTGGRETIAPAGMTGGHSRAMTDRLASIKNRMHMNGEVTLSNGASMKQFIEDGEGYIQLTDSDGSVYMIKAKSIQGVDMADAIGKLFKAYKAGNVSEYLVQPEEHKPENVEPEPAEDTGSSSPEPEVSVGAYRYALQMRPAAPGAIPEGNKAILPRPDEGDRMLLAQYRASLKSAIQRKANISQAISRYEKLLNRTQKAATDIKRLRPLVEDAINKGILDVDPDLVNHANEFLVIGDRSWRVGQYYDCAGDIVRIKSLDFDSQRADVEIIFTFKGTKSGNWDVKTLDKQVDVTPDEDAVMQKISGGVSIAGINDIVSCDDFYRFQQRGMIKITDSYGVQTTESGYSIDFVGTYTDPLKHAVYPDRRDGALKSSIAKWVLGMMSEGNNRQIRSAEAFLVELFGSNYGDVIASYGDTLSPEALQEKIADAIARMPEKTSQGATRNGDSELEVTNAIFGTNEFRASDYEITTAQFGTIGIYSNKAEIKQAMDAASARIAAEREANLNHAVAALTQSWVTAIREAATTGKITPAIADVVNDGSKFMDAYQMDAVKLPSAYGQLSYRMTYNLVSMFSDLAILGLVDLNEVTPELLSMRKNHVEILQRINTVLAGRTDEEKQADADRINLALGNITEEEIAARNEKQEELSSIQGDATSIAQSLGLNYRVSTADLKMMYAPKFAAGEVFGLQEASGMKGVLFRAKDAIKAKFGARWLPAKAKNSDFPGNWWIIETKHNVADVLAVIQQYA
ncbi:TPA: hypothetical protein ROA89_003820 [Escherichia coli]|nr:hypothetical protein [Escherichia coli]MBA8164593.1 hypothetical protein [Escherichia coli]PGG09803.1 hypothetical protein BMR30_15385 [Escherichia coli]HAH2512765.1 hypothetical protein [Escherichia coli]HCO5373669.1 hypothetical protein [Escherichia coli]HCO7292672.1 hypothetical protein [Escherichia coli]